MKQVVTICLSDRERNYIKASQTTFLNHWRCFFYTRSTHKSISLAVLLIWASFWYLRLTELFTTLLVWKKSSSSNHFSVVKIQFWHFINFKFVTSTNWEHPPLFTTFQRPHYLKTLSGPILRQSDRSSRKTQYSEKCRAPRWQGPSLAQEEQPRHL